MLVLAAVGALLYKVAVLHPSDVCNSNSFPIVFFGRIVSIPRCSNASIGEIAGGIQIFTLNASEMCFSIEVNRIIQLERVNDVHPFLQVGANPTNTRVSYGVVK